MRPRIGRLRLWAPAVALSAVVFACGSRSPDDLDPYAVGVELSIPPTAPDDPAEAGFTELAVARAEAGTTPATIAAETATSDRKTVQIRRRFSLPEDVTAWVSNEGDSVLLQWKHPSTGPTPTSYQILRDGEPFGSIAGTAFYDLWIEAGALYTYEVRPAPGEAEIGWRISVSIPEALGGKSRVVRYGAPVDLRASLDDSLDSVTLTWKPPIAGPSPNHYEVHRDGSLLATVSGLRYVDEPVERGKHYKYTVRARGDQGEVLEASSDVELALQLTSTTTGVAPTLVLPPPAVVLSQGASAPDGHWYSIELTRFAPGAEVTVACSDSVDQDFFAKTLMIDDNGTASDPRLCYSADGPEHWVSANGRMSNTVVWDQLAVEPGTSTTSHGAAELSSVPSTTTTTTVSDGAQPTSSFATGSGTTTTTSSTEPSATSGSASSSSSNSESSTSTTTGSGSTTSADS